MNKTKRIHTITIWNESNQTIVYDFETYGDYQTTISKALDYLKTLDKTDLIRILWVYQDYYWSETTRVYIGDGTINNVVSNCASDNKVTVEKAIKLIKYTNINGEMSGNEMHVPNFKKPISISIAEELKDE